MKILGGIRFDGFDLLVLQNDSVHVFMEFSPLYLLAEAVLNVSECFVLHCRRPSLFDGI